MTEAEIKGVPQCQWHIKSFVEYDGPPGTKLGLAQTNSSIMLVYLLEQNV